MSHLLITATCPKTTKAKIWPLGTLRVKMKNGAIKMNSITFWLLGYIARGVKEVQPPKHAWILESE
jgi:hypothetical protein